MNIRVENLGRGILVDSSDNYYVVDNEVAYDEKGHTYTLSDYDENDDVIEITKMEVK